MSSEELKNKIQIGNPESFLARIRKGNDRTKIITIDKKITEFLGLDHGDVVKIWIKKVSIETE